LQLDRKSFLTLLAAISGGRVEGLEMYQLARLLRDQKGANAIEYALIAGLIATAAVFAMSNLGSGVNNLYGNVSSKLG
jgi:pilus assembly protein Flp/PilA